jgi:hypothetical protein
VPPHRARSQSVHADKLTLSLADELKELGIIVGESPDGWLRFKRAEGDLYMALLADALARLHHLEPLTDRYRNENRFLQAQLQGGDTRTSISKFVLDDLIPAPNSKVSLPAILRFRQKNEEELLRFRRSMRDFVRSLETVEDEDTLAERLEERRDDVHEQSLMLARKLKENRIETIYSSLEVSVPSKAEGFMALVSMPLGAVVGASKAAVRVGRQVFQGRIRHDSLLADNAYSYVYKIGRELA